jgi:peptidoglycan/LPS O-acetylase OafA/YrhL
MTATIPVNTTTRAAETRFPYLPQLDGIRALAILMVLVHHGLSPRENGGYVGVEVFFVLSGYLITSILLSEWRRRGFISFKKFYIRRLARLYPPLIVAAGVLFIPAVILAPSGWAYLKSNFIALTYLTPFSVALDNGIAVDSWRHTWSLGIEELFYLVWPLLLVLMLRSKRPRGLAMLVAGVLTVGLLGALVVTDGHLVSDFLRAGGMFLGCLIALVLNLRRPSANWRWLSWIGLAMLAFVYWFPLPATWAVTGANLATALLILGLVAIKGSLLTRVLALRPVVYVGIISYEIYLWHFPLLYIGMWANQTPNMIDVSWWAIPLAIGCAAVSHRLITPLVGRMKARYGS